MNMTKKACGQTQCALASSFPHIVKCERLKNTLLEKEETAPNGFNACGEASPKYVAITMFNRALVLAHTGYANDALTCYSALVTSFSGNEEGTQEIIAGAKHNHKVLEKLIVRFP